MKSRIANYIGRLFMKEESLTDAQVRVVAYWELVDFQCGTDESYRKILNKFWGEYNHEMSLVV